MICTFSMAAGTGSARTPGCGTERRPPSSPVARISASAVSTAASIAAPAFLVSCSAPAFACLLISASRELPLGYTLAALWSGQEGSLLLWLLVLTGVSDAALLLNRRLVVDVLPWTVPILAGIGAYFAFIPNAVASRSPPRRRRERLGMNASLQNPYMMIHRRSKPATSGSRSRSRSRWRRSSRGALPEGRGQPVDRPDLDRGVVFLLGSVVVMWPDAREQRQLARRSLEIDPRPVVA
jgi:hypothetical protein